MAMKLFELKTSMYQNPAFAGPNGCKTQGLFNIDPILETANFITFKHMARSKLIFVLDVSGSMDGLGISALKETLKLAIPLIADGNTVGVLTFSGSGTASWLIKPEVMNPATRQKMLAAIQALRAGGSTYLHEPWKKAIDELKGSQVEVKSIQFLSDGDSTVNPDDDKKSTLALMVELQANGIQASLFGMGSDYNAAFMADLTTAANADFYHVSGNGSGLAQMMAANAVRAAIAVAGNVTVEIEPVNGFKIESKFDNLLQAEKYEAYRTAPQLKRLTPIGGTVVDYIGAVNTQEGIPYQITFVGPALTPPAGATSWDVVVATMTIRYDLSDGEHTEVIDFVQTFTTDFGLVRQGQNASVAGTMRTTAGTMNAADLVNAFSAAQTMGDTARMNSISMAMTNAQEAADRGGLSGLSATFGDLLDGMASGDTDALKAKQTRMMNSADMSDLLGGMQSGGKDE